MTGIKNKRYLNFKKLLLLCVFISPGNVNAQSSGAIKGSVSEKNVAIEFANVILLSSKDSTKIIRSALTDSLGNFNISAVPEGNYILKIQIIGYLPIRMNVFLDSLNSFIDLKNIEIKTDHKLLESVEIITHKDLIKKTAQGFIINAKDNLTQAGGTATDLLKNTPTIVVDADGVITIRGKTPLILINGRNSSLGATDRIPASSIESIEIINNPSAMYDADAEGGIINITLKKNIARGTNGSAALGGGYGAKERINSSFIINHSAGKFNIGLAYDNRFAGRTRKAGANRTNFNLPAEYYLIQNRFDNRFEQTQNLKFNFDYSPDKKNTLSFEAIGNLDGQDNDETLTSMFRSQSDTFNTKNSRESIEIGREKVAEFALNYKRKFNDERKFLTVNLSSSFNFETENTDITTQSLKENNEITGNKFLQRTYNYQNSNVSNLKVDFAQPISKKGIIETGYKAISRFTNADFQSLYQVNSLYVANPLASNIFNFREQIHAAYLQYRGYIGKADSAKLKYDIGVRAEQVYNDGKTANSSIGFNRQYFNLFPTANLAYFISQSNFIKLSFSRRINRPSLGQLNPFTDLTDSLNQHSGNSNLGPELINSLEAGHNKEWRKISLSTVMFYRYATNIIRPYIFVADNGVALTRPVNFGSSATYGLEEIISIFPSKFWSVNTSFSIYEQDINGSNVSPDVANNVLSWYGKIINNLSLWKGSKLQLIGNYVSPVATPQGSRIAVYNIDLGFQQKIIRGKGGLGLVITDIFNTQKSGLTANGPNFAYARTFKVDTRAVLFTFAYSFGTAFKETLMENKFSND